MSSRTNRARSARRRSSDGARRIDDGWTVAVTSGRVETVHVIGPAPCAIERIKSRWRWHVLLRSRRSSELTRVLSYFATHFEPAGRAATLRVVIDRDPVSLL